LAIWPGCTNGNFVGAFFGAFGSKDFNEDVFALIAIYIDRAHLLTFRFEQNGPPRLRVSGYCKNLVFAGAIEKGRIVGKCGIGSALHIGLTGAKISMPRSFFTDLDSKRQAILSSRLEVEGIVTFRLLTCCEYLEI